MSVRFLVISTGYNCARYARKFYESLRAQTYRDFTAVLVDDGSLDGTEYNIEELPPDDRITFHCFPDNYGAAYRRCQAIHDLAEDQDPETVVVIVGMDDELMPEALERMSEHYREGKSMTYGNWIRSDGYALPKGFLDYPPEVHADRSYRKVLYRATGPNSFKRFLFNELTEEDFKYKGEWVRATTESNLNFSCLEMCGEERIGIVREKIVLYNQRSDNTVNREGRSYQNAVYEDVVSRKKKPILKR